MIIFKPSSAHWITLFVTTDCNLRCDYCYNAELKNSELNFEKARKIIDWFYQQTYAPERGIAFFGGEPLLKFDLIKKIVQYGKIKYPEIVYSITTNGTLITKENIELLKSFKYVSVSIDGPKEVHNLHRKFKNGKGSFDSINFAYLKNLKNLHINSVITPQNIYHFHKTILFFQKLNVRHSFRIAYELDWKEKDIEEFRLQMRWFANYFLSSYNDIRKRRLFLPIYAFLNTIKRFDDSHFYCEAGRSSFAITPDGDLFPCHRFYPINRCYLGNVLTHLNLKPLKINNYFKITFPRECKNCEAKSLCPQQCSALKKYFLKESSSRMPPHICTLIHIVYNTIKYIIKKLQFDSQFKKEYGSILAKVKGI